MAPGCGAGFDHALPAFGGRAAAAVVTPPLDSIRYNEFPVNPRYVERC